MADAKSIKNTKENYFLAKYFEIGCVCLLTGRINKPDTQDLDLAVDYYMEECTCSRHPESATRECWDRKLDHAEKQALKELIKSQTKTRVQE